MMRLAIFCAVLLCAQGAFSEPIAKKAISKEAAAFAAVSVASGNSTFTSKARPSCVLKCKRYSGYDIMNVEAYASPKSRSASDCCNKCKTSANCRTWNWAFGEDGGRYCWMSTATNGAFFKASGIVSGEVKC